MQVRVRLFAGLRERAGASELELELPEGALVGDALERMRALTEGVPVVMAVNQEYADAGRGAAHRRRGRADPADIGWRGRALCTLG